jgi:uncharacterized membrane protein
VIVGPVQFEAPLLLALGLAMWIVAWLIARRSMSGLGARARAASLIARLLVIGLLCGALAEPQLRRESRDVASVVVYDISRSVPLEQRTAATRYFEEALRGSDGGERLGVVTVGEEALVQALATPGLRELPIGHTGGDDASDLGAGVRLAMAIAPDDAATRLLLVSDGNETTGGLLRAAEGARAAGTPIDVYPVLYEFESEVALEQIVAPSSARIGETVSLRFVLEATRATTGRLSLLVDGQPVDLDGESPLFSRRITLEAGTNVHSERVTIPGLGALRFEAYFEPDDAGEDSIAENNRARAVVFVASQGRALAYVRDPAAAAPLLEALAAAEIRVEVRDPSQGHESIEELAAYDGVALIDVPADRFTQRQQEELRAYVHDLGGGLLVVGGENSYGAGGWIGSPLADALPVKLDPPQRRQLSKGALAIIIDHSGSMGEPVSARATKQQVANEAAALAVGALTRLDIVCVIEFDTSHRVLVPPTPKGDGAQIQQIIRGISTGGGTYMYGGMREALEQLRGVDAGVRHVILLTDGQSSGDPSEGLEAAARMAAAGITISTIGVGTNADMRLLQTIAQTGGGRWYAVTQRDDMLMLPQIFIREAKTIQRSLIWEGDPVEPARQAVGAETLRGFGAVPAITGYIVTADREGLSQVTLRGPEEDPILAQWQHGLGRVVAFMSDAATKWSADWVAWPGYDAFWQQHLRWAMRPAGSANVRVTTQDEGDRTRVIVDALDAAGERLNFARFQGRAVLPDLTSVAVDLRQTGPGRYEGSFDSSDPGSYVVNLRYEAPGATGALERGAVQASVVRSEGDERRALETNLPILQQVADLTGGRILSPDPTQADLFRRDGLTPPVSLRPIWLLVAALATGLFLADVAIRRVRIDIPAMARAVKRALSRRAAASEEQIDALRAARERSRQEMAERAERASTEEAAPAKATASVKFEAGAGSPAATVVDAPAARKPAPATKATPEQPRADDDEEGISRLMRAKRRARQDMGEDDGDDAR